MWGIPKKNLFMEQNGCFKTKFELKRVEESHGFDLYYGYIDLKQCLAEKTHPVYVH